MADNTTSLGQGVLVSKREDGNHLTLVIQIQTSSECVLHWGVSRRPGPTWQRPPQACWPAGTIAAEGTAVRTPFTSKDRDVREVTITFALPAPARHLVFVIHFPKENRWLKNGANDFTVPLPSRADGGDPRLSSPKLWDLAEEIVDAEKGASSWTLMHRFNLCHDLLGEPGASATGVNPESLALLFVWLRYSSTRQLDWQRRYNTKPRELSHAQDRLTTRLAAISRKDAGAPPLDTKDPHSSPQERSDEDRRPSPNLTRWGPHSSPQERSDEDRRVGSWVRLLLTTLGRGGDGQRVRDEILHIMHRNHLKETSGTFLEEWHQKLHNNTTPDDVVICEAYLGFLRSNGDLARFYQTLEGGGVARERLKSFERPIKTAPHFAAEQKDALIKDFENFLQILKSVHSGTDLASAAAATRSRLSEPLQKQLDRLLASRQHKATQRDVLPTITSVREGLKKLLGTATEDVAVRDLLFLDLALEELLRGMIERENLSRLEQDDLAERVNWVLRNLNLSLDSQELSICCGHWSALLARPRTSRDWALHAKSVADRASRWVQGFTGELHQRLQPKAEYLGEAFEVKAWTVPLFSEEVIRGGPVFALSLLLRPLDALLRKAAGLGGWQIISPAQASGKVRVVERLLAVQGERFAEATVLVADTVTGSEEIPEGVTAVLTSDAPDLVSHVAVRARNNHVLFATCFEPTEYERLKALRDRNVLLEVTPGGEVTVGQAVGQVVGQAVGQASRLSVAPAMGQASRLSSPWVLTQDQFTSEAVGGKSNNLNGLRGRLADWIHLPTSVALPFGTFEKALEDSGNHDLRCEADALIATVEQHPAETLSQLRALLLNLAAPPGLKESLLATWQRVGLPHVSWEQAWTAIRRVWASKWNDRAYLSRRARGVPHDSLRMAVLIQQVVEADHAFVIHTANPLTGNRAELYAEVVLGMGETLVGNYPGRALGFVCCKADRSLELLSYPGKSVGLYGKGVIFRSDSNGEDLADFAGAGLYDSYLAEEPEHRILDYRSENLVWDQNVRDELLRSIARVGTLVENLLGSPQDVEGAVTGGRFYVVQTRPQVGLGGANNG